MSPTHPALGVSEKLNYIPLAGPDIPTVYNFLFFLWFLGFGLLCRHTVSNPNYNRDAYKWCAVPTSAPTPSERLKKEWKFNLKPLQTCSPFCKPLKIPLLKSDPDHSYITWDPGRETIYSRVSNPSFKKSLPSLRHLRKPRLRENGTHSDINNIPQKPLGTNSPRTKHRTFLRWEYLL